MRFTLILLLALGALLAGCESGRVVEPVEGIGAPDKGVSVLVHYWMDFANMDDWDSHTFSFPADGGGHGTWVPDGWSEGISVAVPAPGRGVVPQWVETLDVTLRLYNDSDATNSALLVYAEGNAFEYIDDIEVTFATPYWRESMDNLKYFNLIIENFEYTAVNKLAAAVFENLDYTIGSTSMLLGGGGGGGGARGGKIVIDPEKPEGNFF